MATTRSRSFLPSISLMSGTETTIQKLFSAQQTNPHAEPIISRDQSCHAAVAPQRSTLHSFWHIQQPKPIFAVPNFLQEAGPQHCEDCDRRLISDDAMEIDEVRGLDGNNWSCQACGRTVCDLCAVNRDARRCLNCAR